MDVTGCSNAFGKNISLIFLQIGLLPRSLPFSERMSNLSEFTFRHSKLARGRRARVDGRHSIRMSLRFYFSYVGFALYLQFSSLLERGVTSPSLVVCAFLFLFVGSAFSFVRIKAWLISLNISLSRSGPPRGDMFAVSDITHVCNGFLSAPEIAAGARV